MNPGALPPSVQLPADEAQQIRSLLDELGLPGIIDVRTHFMPDSVMAKVWAYFDAVGPLTGAPWPIAYRGPEAERLTTLREFGVERFTSLNYPHKPGMATWLNDWSTQFAGEHPDCIHSATFYPEEGAAAYVEEAISQGARIFKAHVQVGDYDPNDPKLNEVWGVLQDSQVPVVIHAGNGPAPGTHTGPQGIQKLLRRFPNLCLVIAHLGLPEYDDFLRLSQQYPRVYLDTTMVFTDFTEANHPFPSASRPLLLELSERILFGSDFPNIPYCYSDALRAITRLGFGDEWVRGVLRENAARLLGHVDGEGDVQLIK